MNPGSPKIKLFSATDTEEFGAKLSPYLKEGDIVKITGALGAGKTTLVRGIVSGMGGNLASVHSPTFSLVHEYRTTAMQVIHCDFYRLPKDSELEDLGGPEFFDEAKLYLLEWPERVESILSTIPNRLLGVDLQVDANCHEATLIGPWQIVDQIIIGC
jgi:tRNA threonylcarbamoyladenosine biosynthesis protein TsaE